MSKPRSSARLPLWIAALCSLAVAVPGTAVAAGATAPDSAETTAVRTADFRTADLTTADGAAPAAKLGPRQVGTRYPGKVGVGRWHTPVFGAYKQNPTNPLAGRTMGVYMGPQDQVWEPFTKTRGQQRTLLGKIALRPRTKWFGAWIRPNQIAASVRRHIENAQEGDPSVLVQMTAFALQPWYTEACNRAPNKAEQQYYKRWIRGFARGVGNTPTAIILQPDLPFVLCSPRPRVPYHLVTYAAKELSKRPNAAVYIDVGASDWPKNQPRLAANILKRAGVKHVRGFALNATHYAPTAWDVRHGTKVVKALNRMGIRNKKFVVNTSSNGKGFDFGNARGPHEDHANVCRTKRAKHCVTLGIPPTTAVAHAKWRLPRDVRVKARKHTDAYLWFGRPWLYMQNDPFQMQRALQLARTSPW
ncbi:glycoside hydrolase family 6 protein [Nocardioides massiliensis]|uniref:Glucanase n=1 Tax=Nocardioides massiliensis TaxID=1325935 RepID=A0ABT9NKH1_9ACTN|nr:glycoside hydrolase family 6 protein [Nocardioides massiliensis]MDP9820918.1 hypothetical protein [Nocardioides massiliensis]